MLLYTVKEDKSKWEYCQNQYVIKTEAVAPSKTLVFGTLLDRGQNFDIQHHETHKSYI
jgi:hypothetical protein